MSYYNLDQATFDEAKRLITELNMAKGISLNDWDEKFVVDMWDKLQKYDRDLKCTPAQFRQLRRIHGQQLGSTTQQREEPEDLESTDRKFRRFDRR